MEPYDDNKPLTFPSDLRSKMDYDARITAILAVGCFVIGVLGWTMVALIIYLVLSLGGN